MYTTKMCNCTKGIVFLVFVAKIALLRGEFQQQRAKIVYANPKHVKSASMFTTRSSRSAPYSTDMNITMLSSWGNNVTIKILYYKLKAKSDAAAIEMKTCDMVKHKWLKDWVEKFSNLTLGCPLKYGVYRFNKFDLPPKNFPVQILLERNVEYESSLLVFVTKTKEPILEVTVGLMFRNNPKSKRKS